MDTRNIAGKWVLRLLSVATAVLCPSRGQAAGYFIGEADAAANGRALAVTARLVEPSAIFFNPAGLAFTEGLKVSVGGVAVIPFFDYSDPEGRRPSATAKREVTTIPHVYASYGFGKWAVGLGFNAPFGLALKWPVDFAGRHLTNAIDLKEPTIYVGMAFRPIERVSVGAAVRIVPATVEMIQRFNLVSDDGSMQLASSHLGASAVGIGGLVGIMANPIDRLHLGFSYLTRTKFNFSNGSAAFWLPEGLGDTSVFHDQGGTTTLTSPDMLSFGVGYDVLDNLYLEFNFNYTLWSVHKRLDIHFDNDPTGTLNLKGKQPKNWKDTPTFRIGGEYRPIKEVAVRLGGGYDFTPAPNETLGPELPDSSRGFLALGAGYTYAPLGLKLDVAYTLVLFRTRTVTAADGNPFPATYKNTAHLVGFTVSVTR